MALPQSMKLRSNILAGRNAVKFWLMVVIIELILRRQIIRTKHMNLAGDYKEKCDYGDYSSMVIS